MRPPDHPVMTPATGEAERSIVRAGHADLDVLSRVIAGAFFDLARPGG